MEIAKEALTIVNSRSSLNSSNSASNSQKLLPLVALAGNPNSGKTTLFNALTGLNYKVANYPGVTVERKEGKCELPNLGEVTLLDLPGIYSVFGTSLDEQIATKALLGDIADTRRPDLVVVVVDATNLERNLYLSTQLIDLGFPIILALTMSDLADKNGIAIRTELLSRQLDIPVVKVIAPKKKGLEELGAEINALLTKNPLQVSKKRLAWLAENSPFREVAARFGHKNRITDKDPFLQILTGAALLSESSSTTDKKIRNELHLAREALRKQNIDAESYEATCRYQWINSVVKASCSYLSENRGRWSDKIDWLTTHRIWGVVTFLALMAFMFQSIFLWASVPMAWIDGAIAGFGNWLGRFLPQGLIKSLLVDGIISGVGSVLIFIPQIAILFFFIGLLEDSGYLSRAAFVTDKIMRKVGLQGRSFIPLLSSFACAIPGILSTRTIPTFADRLATILIAPLMSCSARLPVYSLLIAAFIPTITYFGFISLQGLVLLGMYLLGLLGALAVAWTLKRTLLKGHPAYFVMEMPPFRVPSLKLVLRSVLDRVITFVKNAGTVILACSIVLWFLASYPQGVGQESYAKRIGHLMEPVIQPLGFNWEIGVGILASFAAREVFVSALATVYNVSDQDDSVKSVLTELEKRRQSQTFSMATALSLMVFYVFACQCMSTLAVCRRETGSWAWTGFMFTYMTILAYGASWITYHAVVFLRI